ncbi:ion transporter [Mariniflexile litorale]|uniref:Ion transporter n=1 Tax=Mariniflexile litorale TaxID=3045158 RepID=A0AAU7EEK6_9FLAO|nr:ion transporter [Mariniflexile sp. KMM 9835]MDQ8211601.1 ion transporter [Mariniflexile sp. KMM 9835]
MSMQQKTNWKHKLHEVIYGTHTPAGKLFDIILLIAILYSIIIVMLESIQSFDKKYHDFFNVSEWIITILFSIEYILRIICVNQPKKYIFSFYGMVDLLSTLPKYISFFILDTQFLSVFRALRLLRVFRILKLIRFVGESNKLIKALKNSRSKIFIFIFFVFIVSIILGTVMYLIEGPENGFKSIPQSIYWCIVTLTTVGFGDITPQTAVGQILATVIMIIGYGIIAVPTGIVSAEYTASKDSTSNLTNSSCKNCGADIILSDASYCRKCGNKLNSDA